METQNSEIAVLMVPLPLQSHLNQLLHLSQLITSYNIQLHFAGSETHTRQAKIRLQGWDPQTLSNIHFHDFKLPSYNNSPLSNPNPSTSFPSHFQPLFEATTHLRNPISKLITNLSDKFRRVIVIHDLLMSYVVQDVKLFSNVEAYTFMASCAFYFFLHVWASLPADSKPFVIEPGDIPECIPTEEGCFSPDSVEFGKKQFECLGFESGWIYNTSRVIEGKYVDFMEKLCPMKKIFAIGPLNPIHIKSEENIEDRHECLKWLDEQEEGSVIYVSFGSTTSLTNEQIEELANGLERSGVKFIWVVRNADPSNVQTEGEVVRKPQLPEGYEERVKDRGMVVRDWAPQLEILAHGSVGGFMSHCGWNSCIESISMGVPIVAWPIHSEQPRNAVFVSKVLRIGVLVRDWERREEIVSASTIENVVKKLMASNEGKEMQRRAKELGEDVRGSVDKGGVSCLERDSFIEHISRE